MPRIPARASGPAAREVTVVGPRRPAEAPLPSAPQGSPDGTGHPDPQDAARTGRSRGPLAAAVVAVIVTAAGAALGAALVSGGPLSLVDVHRPPAPPAVPGQDGLAPGGTETVDVLLDRAPSTGTVPGRVTVRATSGAEACPAAVWSVTVTPGGAALSPHRTRVPATVALAPSAPVGCQGRELTLTVDLVAGSAPTGGPFLGGHVVVRTGVLGTPGIAVAESQPPTLVITAPAGPAPLRYVVQAVTPDGTPRDVCTVNSATRCVDTGAGGGTASGYRVTAVLGDTWSRTSGTVRPDEGTTRRP